MNSISLEDALLLFDKWKSEGSAVVAFCVTPSVFAISLIDARVEEVSRDFVRFSGDRMDLQIFLSDAGFVYLEARELGSMEDFPGQLSDFNFTFEECLRIDSSKSSVMLFSRR